MRGGGEMFLDESLRKNITVEGSKSEEGVCVLLLGEGVDEATQVPSATSLRMPCPSPADYTVKGTLPFECLLK